MKDFLRIGNRWLNPAHVLMVDCEACPGKPVKARLHITNDNKGPQVLDIEGDAAEGVLDCLGFGKAVRDKEAKDAEHAAKVASDAADKAAAHEAKKAEHAEKAHAAHAH